MSREWMFRHARGARIDIEAILDTVHAWPDSLDADTREQLEAAYEALERLLDMRSNQVAAQEE